MKAGWLCRGPLRDAGDEDSSLPAEDGRAEASRALARCRPRGRSTSPRSSAPHAVSQPRQSVAPPSAADRLCNLVSHLLCAAPAARSEVERGHAKRDGIPRKGESGSEGVGAGMGPVVGGRRWCPWGLWEASLPKPSATPNAPMPGVWSGLPCWRMAPPDTGLRDGGACEIHSARVAPRMPEFRLKLPSHRATYRNPLGLSRTDTPNSPDSFRRWPDQQDCTKQPCCDYADLGRNPKGLRRCILNIMLGAMLATQEGGDKKRRRTRRLGINPSCPRA